MLFRRNIVQNIHILKRFQSNLRDLSSLKKSNVGSYFHQVGSKPFVSGTIGNLVDSSGDRFGDELAVVDRAQNIRKTFTQFQHDINKLASGFLALKLKKGERIGIWSPNRYEWILSQLAAAKAGLILVAINPAYQAQELEFCLNKVGVRSIIFPETFLTQNYYKILCSLAPEIADTKPGFIKTKKFPTLESLILMEENNLPGTFKLNEVMKAAGNNETQKLSDLQKEIRSDDGCMIMFTSGTTSNPKAALSSHFALINSCALVCDRLNYFQEKGVLCCVLPMFHIFGFEGAGVASVLSGVTCVYPSHEYSMAKCLQAIQSEKCTHFYATPTIFIDMMRHADFNHKTISSLKFLLGGGARFAPELLDRIMSVFSEQRMLQVYGTTETTANGTIGEISRSLKEKELLQSTPVSQHIEMKIVDNENQLVPFGSDGEICIRGSLLMKGYWDDEEKIKQAFKDGWYHTGDLGSLTAEGLVTVKGRVKELIIRGGENISPKEIEDVLISHPSILDAQVIGVRDERLGEDVCVWIRLAQNHTLTPEQVKDFCRGKMAHYKIPKYVRFVDAFPMTLSGKVQKFKMVEEMNRHLSNNNK